MSGATTSPLPGAVGSAPALPPAEPQWRAVDRFLPERTEALALEGLPPIADLAAGEERLQAVVGRPGEEHPTKHLPLLVAGERSGDRLAPEEAVASLGQLLGRPGEALAGGDSGGRLGQLPGAPSIPAGREPPFQGRPERFPQGLDRGLAAGRLRGAPGGRLLGALPGTLQGEGKTLGDEGREAVGEGGARSAVEGGHGGAPNGIRRPGAGQGGPELGGCGRPVGETRTEARRPARPQDRTADAGAAVPRGPTVAA
jgi:hypothetical protein